MQRVLVTGGTGFIGRHLIPMLIQNGWIVSATYRQPEPPRMWADAVRWRPWHESGASALNGLLAGQVALCHLAAFIPPNMQDAAFAETCLKTNALLTLYWAEAAAHAALKRMVYVSSAQSYEWAKTPVTEEQPCYPSTRAPYYLASKLLGEIYIEHFRKVALLPAISLRLASCYGPGMPSSAVVSRFMQAAKSGQILEVWDGGIPSADYIYVEDTARLIACALQAGAPGIYNAGSGQSTTVHELANQVCKVYAERTPSMQIQESVGPVPTSFPALDMTKTVTAWSVKPRSLAKGLRLYRQCLETSIPASPL